MVFLSELKFEAVSKLYGKNTIMWINGLFSCAMTLSGVWCSLLPLLCLLYPPSLLFTGAQMPYAAAAVTLLCALLVFFILGGELHRFYNRARLYYMFEENAVCPESLYTFTQGIRFIKCRITVLIKKMLWAAVFFLPFTVSTGLLIFNMTDDGYMVRSIFITGVLSSLVLFLTGALFYFCVTGRYYLTDYLMFINPLEPPESIIVSSVIIMRGKTIRLFVRRLYMLTELPRLLFPLLYPEARMRMKAMKALICREIYNEKC